MKSVMNTSTQESADFPEHGKTAKPSSNPASTSLSSSWLRLKNPRIVRVSRAFGGKDRHSKVCTVKGLRDRRVRLSVPTAIQLYDLQHRLGLNQPSKVVDWLLNEAKDDIDRLPPLQMPPLGFLTRNHATQLPSPGPKGFKNDEDVYNWDARTSFWSPEGQNMKGKSKQVVTESEKESFNSLLPHHHMPYSSFSQWEPNNFPLSNLGMSMSSHGFVSNDVHHHNMSMPAQILVCPSGPTTQPYFPANSSLEVDPRQMSQFQMLMMSSTGASSQNLLPSSHLYSIGQSTRPFHFEFGVSCPQHSQNNGESEQNKNQVQFQER